MAKAKNWAFTNFGQEKSVVLEITPAGGGEALTFTIAEYTDTFGRNEIPQASCLLAIGRNVRNVANVAAVNQKAAQLDRMLRAQVYVQPQGEFSPAPGTDWPAERQLVFDGFFLGFAGRKVNGKVQIIAHLAHWLLGLTFSSTLSSANHPANPLQLIFPTMVPTANGGASETPAYLPIHLGGAKLSEDVLTDVWGATKDFLCHIAKIPLVKFPKEGGCADLSQAENTGAIEALSRIEGGSGDCQKAYKFSKALNLLGSGAALTGVAISNYIANMPYEVWAHSTFWDVIAGIICPEFHLAVVPLVDRALVVADAPTIRKTYAVELAPEDYLTLDLQSLLVRPLRGVIIYAHIDSQGGGNNLPQGDVRPPPDEIGVAGCFQPSEGFKEGVVLFKDPPKWLTNISSSGDYAGGTTGRGGSGGRGGSSSGQEPVKTATTPDGGKVAPQDPPPAELLAESRDLYRRYAQALYNAEMLRGRMGTVTTKLRWDISPCSVLKLQGSPEQFLGAEDSLASDQYGSVVRLTHTINAEEMQAYTTFQLSHLRSAAENQSDRTSMDAHPLFGDAAFLGAPLVEAYRF